jgi:hypothetical protein
LRRPVLAQIAWPNRETRRLQLVEQFGVQQVHLAKIRLRRIARHAGPVLHGPAHMRVTLDAQALDQHDRVFGQLAEAVA